MTQRPYKITRRVVRGNDGWHWAIDVTTRGRRSNFTCSKPHSTWLRAAFELYFGRGWHRWIHCHRLWADFHEEGIV